MKKTLLMLTTSLMLLFFYACQKDFLQIPDTSGAADLEKVFSNSRNATSALLVNYRRALGIGWAGGIVGMDHGTIGGISGELSKGWSWHATYAITDAGLSPNRQDAVRYDAIWPIVRSLWVVNENIDKVPDMDATMKGYVKGESEGLVAYVYLNMFKSYGGLPIIDRTYVASEDLLVPRSSLQETLDFTLKLCDDAIAALPDNWPADQTGRLTKGAVMTMKAQVLMYAARPLFNSSTPYLSLGANNNLICFGSNDPTRWDKAITASEEALAKVKSQGIDIINTGGAGTNAPNPNALADYGTATSIPNNSEIILACKIDENGVGFYYDLSNYWIPSRYNHEKSGLQGNFLSNYRKADGTEQDWPQLGDPAPRPALDYRTRFAEMEPRFRADFVGPGISSANNPGDANWGYQGWLAKMGNYSTGDNFPNSSDYGAGTAEPTKFYYKAGGRLWFEFPVLRAAELYLNLAEAYNEVGKTNLALQNLNIVRNRGGIPSVTETDKDKLREIIQREWAVEFLNENKRYYDVKHWKLANIGDGIIGGPRTEFYWKVTKTDNAVSSLISYYTAVAFNAYWNPSMYLEPFPQGEVNKQSVIQNPGY